MPVIGLLFIVIGVLGMSLAKAEDCLMPDSNPFAQTNSTYGWFFPYEDSIVFAQERMRTNVPPFDAQWKRLVQLERRDPVTVTQLDLLPSGDWVLETVPIEQPVLVVSWAAPLVASPGYDERLSRLSGTVEPLKFRTFVNQQGPDGKNANQTLWFTVHGQAAAVLDELFQQQDFDMTRSCFNLTASKSYSENLAACQQAMLWGVPSVGVPYGFGWTDEPYGANSLPWWNSTIYVGVTDRRSLVRPSFNPTVLSEAEAQARNLQTSLPKIATLDGVPQWNAADQQYTLPSASPVAPGAAGNFVRGIWEALCPDYDCLSPLGFLAWDGSRNPYGVGPLPREAFSATGTSVEEFLDENGELLEDVFQPQAVFLQWLTAYQNGNWVTEGPPWPSASGFPFSSVGLTVNWITTSEIVPEDRLFLSEFILKGRAPITWIAKRSGSQYLGRRDSSQVSWCDSCLGDLDMSGAVDVGDLLLVLQAYGQPQPCMTFSDQDFVAFATAPDDLRSVGVDQILAVLDAWGPCTGWPPELLSLRPADCD